MAADKTEVESDTGAIASRLTYFVSTESQPRARRPADAVTVVVGIMLTTWGWATVEIVTPWEQALTDFLGSLPSWAISLFSFAYLLGLVYGLGVLIAVIAGGRRRKPAIRDVLLATTVAAIAGIAIGLLATGEWPYVFPEWGLDDPTPRFPVFRVVLVTAVLVSASPHLSRPMRRLGWTTILLTAMAAVALGYGDPSDAVGALGIGLVAGGGVLLGFGSPRGYPDTASVEASLLALGLDVHDLHIDPQQSWGVRRFVATAPDGGAITVKAYGRDATDSQLMSKAWRALIYREQGATVGFTRLEAVEHEALVTLFASRSGVEVPEILAVGQVSSEIALLAVEAGSRPLIEVGSDGLTDAMLVDVWRDVGRLHTANISHGALTTSTVHHDGTGPLMTDFALGSLIPGETQSAHDVVELLFSLSLLVGAERAVSTAVAGLGKDSIVAVLPYLQVPAVGTATRRAADKPKKVMKELQSAAIAATGEDLPEPVKLRRVTTGNILMLALILLAAYALIPLLTGVDYAAVWSVLQDADWAIMFLALIVGQSYFLAQASATSFAVNRPLPFWPLTILQVAAQFISLAIPSAAGRVAMNAAFLHKFGVPVTTAVAQGAIDGFSGFLVQCVILLIAFLTSDVDIDTGSVDLNWALILLIVVTLAVGGVIAVLRISKLRDRVLPAVKQGWGALMVVLRDPSRAFGLLGSNLWYWLTLGATLWLILTAVGVEMSFGTALVVATATNLLGGFVPIPGGVGVAEAVMTAFLTALGVDQSTAFTATVAYRAITFYLAALEGFFALKWLQRNEYV